MDLKLYLLANGMRVTERAEHAWAERERGPMTLADYASTSGICMRLESDVWVNAPFSESFTEQSEVVLDVIDDVFVVSHRGQSWVPDIIPVPSYHDQYWDDEDTGLPVRYTSLGVTHTDRIRVSPVQGCAWRCTFCDLPYEHRYSLKPLAELRRVIELAADDRPAARHVLVSGGTPAPEHEGWIDEVYSDLARTSPMPVDVMMPPRADPDYPSWLRSSGVNMLSVNMEVSDPTRALRITPNKARAFGRDDYLAYVERAVDAFGVGFVQSLMVFGEAVEPLDSTLAGVQALAERGCMPVLSPFRPDPVTPMGKRGLLPPTMDEMRRMWDATLAICDAVGGGLRPGPRCIPCHHNTVTFSDGSDFYVSLDGDLTAPPT